MLNQTVLACGSECQSKLQAAKLGTEVTNFALAPNNGRIVQNRFELSDDQLHLGRIDIRLDGDSREKYRG